MRGGSRRGEPSVPGVFYFPEGDCAVPDSEGLQRSQPGLVVILVRILGKLRGQGVSPLCPGKQPAFLETDHQRECPRLPGRAKRPLRGRGHVGPR